MSSKPITLSKGATYRRVIRWESNVRAYALITAATQGAPVVITADAHGIPNGWRIDRIASVKGMTQLNTHAQTNGQYALTGLGRRFPNGIKATVLDANTIELNDINATTFGEYTSGGVLEFMAPVDLTGYTAQMQIRSAANSTDVLFEASSTNGRITFDTGLYTTTLTISADDTAALTFTSGVTTLEMTAPDGDVAFLIPLTPVIVQETDVTR